MYRDIPKSSRSGSWSALLMGFKTERARAWLQAGVSHTTFLMPNLTRREKLGLSKFRIGFSNLVSGPKTRRKTSCSFVSVTVSVSRLIKAARTLARCSFNPRSAGVKESEQRNAHAMNHYIETCCLLGLLDDRIESDCISLLCTMARHPQFQQVFPIDNSFHHLHHNFHPCALVRHSILGNQPRHQHSLDGCRPTFICYPFQFYRLCSAMQQLASLQIA